MTDVVIVAGEVGKALNFYANPTPAPAVPLSLTGAVVTLRLLRPDGTLSAALSMTVSMDGTYATRTTLVTDFPTAGLYEYQVTANYGSGLQILKSVPGSLLVSASF